MGLKAGGRCCCFTLSNRCAIVLLALVPLTGLVILAVVGHAIMNRINARKDRDFYAEMLKLRADL
jgi:hypothetical protein